MPPRPLRVRPGGRQGVSSAPGRPPSDDPDEFETIPVSELTEDWVRMIIYGENRTGKTTLSCKFPKPLLLISLDPNPTGGAISVRKEPGVEYLRLLPKGGVITSQRFINLGENQLATGRMTCRLPDHEGEPFRTVVIDSATSLQDVILMEILGADRPIDMNSYGMASQDQYRDRSGRTRECLRPFLNLPMNTVVIAKQRDHNRQDDAAKRAPRMMSSLRAESFFAADLGGQTASWLQDASDYICRLYVDKEVRRVRRTAGVKGKANYREYWRTEETGRTVRKLQTLYHPNYAAGFRSDTPEAVPFCIINPTYEKIKAVIDGERLGDADAEYQDILEAAAADGPEPGDEAAG